MSFNTDKKTRIQDLKSLALKVNNKLTALNDRTSVLVTNSISSAGVRNAIYRGKNLGQLTPEHLAAIRNGSYTDMFIGDYFAYSGISYKIAAFEFGNSFNTNLPYRHIVLITNDIVPADWVSPYPIRYNTNAIGEEGEEGYVESTKGKHYMESNWYVNIRPIFIEKTEELICTSSGSDTAVKPFHISVPTAFNGTSVTFVNLSSKAHLPTIGMVSGSPFLASHPGNVYDQALIFPQLPLFALEAVESYWPRQIYNAPRFMTTAETLNANADWNCSAYTHQTRAVNTNTGYTTYLRPIICIG